MDNFTSYVDFTKRYHVYNREIDDDLRCLIARRSKVIKDVSLTLSSFDRLCYLARLPQFKSLITFD